MNKTVAFLVVLCVIEAFVIGLLLHERQVIPEPDVPTEEFVRDSIIRDSIFIVNDSIQTKIVYIKEQHTKDSVDIMSANDSVLLSTFSRYIEDYNNK